MKPVLWMITRLRTDGTDFGVFPVFKSVVKLFTAPRTAVEYVPYVLASET